MKTWKIALVLSAALASMAAAYASCPVSETCSLDGETMYCVNTDYAGIHEIKTYEHRTIQGNVHRVTVACN